MKIFGINITIGNPERSKKEKIEKEAQQYFDIIVASADLNKNKIDVKGQGFYVWWEDSIPIIVEWIMIFTDEGPVRDVLVKKISSFLKQRAIDIELQNDEFKRIKSKITE